MEAKKKRTVYVDGWHTDPTGSFEFLVEDGRIRYGVLYSGSGATTVYPYMPSEYGGLALVSGIKARYGVCKRIVLY